MTPERTYFNCKEGNWSEDFPLDLSSDPKNYAQFFRDDDSKLGFQGDESVSPFEKYSSMVERISVRNFTQDSDILNACRGFELGMLRSSMGDSVCGLPATCFEYALAWQSDGNLRRRGLSNVGLPFPSWSWAGWVGPIVYPFVSGPKEMEVRLLNEMSLYV